MAAFSRPDDPEPVIRLCQFHVIQAIGRADFFAVDGATEQSGKRVKGAKKKGRRRIAIGVEARSDICQALRLIQRFRRSDPKPWEDWLEEFRDRIRRICEKWDIEEAEEVILEYFDRHWFSDYWRSKSKLNV
jgi:hypothetical protein